MCVDIDKSSHSAMRRDGQRTKAFDWKKEACHCMDMDYTSFASFLMTGRPDPMSAVRVVFAVKFREKETTTNLIMRSDLRVGSAKNKGSRLPAQILNCVFPAVPLKASCLLSLFRLTCFLRAIEQYLIMFDFTLI